MLQSNDIPPAPLYGRETCVDNKNDSKIPAKEITFLRNVKVRTWVGNIENNGARKDVNIYSVKDRLHYKLEV